MSVFTEENGSKITDAVHSGTVSAFGSIYKWIVASLLSINGGALVSLTQQPASHSILLRYAGIWFSLGVVAVIIAAFGAMVAAIGGAMLAASDVKDNHVEMSIFGFGMVVAAVMPLVSAGLFIGGGASVLKTAPYAQATFASPNRVS